MFNKFRFSSKLIPVYIIGLLTLGFGILVPFLGFYWDDWAKTLVFRLFGYQGYWGYYAEDRPLSGWTHILLLALFGDDPTSWQVIALLLRSAAGIGMWWSLSRIWPGLRLLSVFSASLFVVYPVFTQQAAAVTFHQQWLQFGLYFFSIGCMVQSIRIPKHHWYYTLLALVSMGLELTVTEYFIGLEYLRPLIIFFLVMETDTNQNGRLVKTIKRSMPYLVMAIGYTIWRLSGSFLPGEDPYQAVTLFDLIKSPLQTIERLSWTVTRDTLYILVTTWYPSLDAYTITSSMAPFTRISWIVVAITFMLSVLFFLKLNIPNTEEVKPQAQNIRQVFILGWAALFLGVLPAWITGREVIFDFHSNRYAQPAMFGASLIIVGTIFWLSSHRLKQAFMVSALIALATGYHIRITNDYRWDWTQQTRFYWQTSWRMPYLEPGTALLTSKEPFPEQGLFSTSSAINLLYPQPDHTEKMAYWIYALSNRYTPNTLPEPLEMTFYTQFRTLVFEGSTPATVLFYYDTHQTNCLWILDPDEDRDDPDLPDILAASLSLSKTSLIQRDNKDPKYPPIDLFGPEPEHTWCYLYQKASLARQFGEWDMVASLAEEALDQGYAPLDMRSNSPHEWVPFIQGLAFKGSWENAARLTLEAAQIHPRYYLWFCGIWNRLDDESEGGVGKDEAVMTIKNELKCNSW